MDCRTVRTLLESWSDGELEASQAAAVQLHVRGCADCAAAARELEELGRLLKNSAPRYAAPQALRERIVNAGIEPGRSQKPALGRWLLLAASLVFAAALGAVSAWLLADRGTIQTAELLQRDLLASHLRALAAASPVDVVSSDRHTVKPWFAGRVGISPTVPDLAAVGFPLAGGRIDYVGTRRVPVLVYRHGPHLIDVYVLGEAAAGTAEPAAPFWAEAQGYHLVHRIMAGQSLWVVSDLAPEELADFLQSLERAS